MIQTYPRLLHSDKYKLIYAYTSPKHANTWTNDKYTLIYFMILHIDLLYIFSHSHTPTQKPIHTHPHTQAFTHTHSHTPFHTHPFTHTLSHTPFHTQAFIHTPMRTHTQTLTLFHTHTAFHTQAFTIHIQKPFTESRFSILRQLK